jgi:hypothetical protein
MRGFLAMAGLLSVLIAVAIMFYMWTEYTGAVAKPAARATVQANQLAGRSSAGVPIGGQGMPVLADSKFAPVERNGKLVGLTVVVMPTTNGLFEYFGLVPGDTILNIGPFKMGEETLSDFESARDWVQEGMQRQMEMRVDRGGTQITLPRDRDFVPTPGAGTPGTPTGPTGASGQQPQ